MIRPLVHYGIHFLVPVLIAFIFYRPQLKRAIIILISGIIIDVDHLLATPVFDAHRCSIGFHFLHSYIAIAVYMILFALPKTRIYGLALLVHIIADAADCLLMNIGF